MRRMHLWLALLVIAGVAGCGRVIAPDSTAPGSAASSTADGFGIDPASASQPAFEARMKLVGAIVTLDRNFAPRVRKNEAFYVRQLAPGESRVDTVPAYARLEKVDWLPTTANSGDDPGERTRGETGTNPTTLAPGGQIFAPGNHEFILQAPAHAGGGEAHTRFMAGFLPGAWFAGPEPDRWPPSSDGDGRAVDVIDWTSFTTSPAWPPDGRPYFGPDSLRYIPSVRRPPGGDFERRTFYEIYGNRIYARREGDTVHLNAWIVLIHGGYDKDSPYAPRVDPLDPALPAGFAGNPDLYPVLNDLGLVGSPIGFRSQLTMKLANGMVFRAPSSGLYPVFDPTSVFRMPVVAGYVRAMFSGTAYLVARAQDSDGLQDPPISDPIGLVAVVDAGGGTPAERLARRRIITFQVGAGTDAELARAASPTKR